MGKNYNDKLYNSDNLTRVIYLGDKHEYVKRYGGEYMVIVSPIEYNEVMKRVPEGKVTTIGRINKYLAKKFDADITCPLTAGMHINLVANATVERESKGRTDNIVCFWRTLKNSGELNPKYPGGIEHQKEMLEAEGHEVFQKGSKYFVKDYKEKVYELKLEE